jgi:DNA-binding NarL/FixJ family response regulator
MAAPTGAETGEGDEGGPVRLVIGEDSYLVREALTEILDKVESIEVVRSCEDRDALVAAISEERPDAVLTDIRMPPTGTDEGIQVARLLRESDPQIGVVVLSQFADPRYVLELLEEGSAGRAYLLKDRVSDTTQLVSAIEAVAVGGSVIDPTVVELLVRARSRSEASPLATLTPREHDVLSELAQGKSNAAIAACLYLTKRAVEKHVNSIFMKLELGRPDDVSRRVKAALLFLADEPE